MKFYPGKKETNGKRDNANKMAPKCRGMPACEEW